jgi:small basic protein (TIGR04137 family)
MMLGSAERVGLPGRSTVSDLRRGPLRVALLPLISPRGRGENAMSIDRSLKTAGNLVAHRNVLKRHERIERMKETKGFDPDQQKVLHLQKTGNRAIGKK